MTANQVQIRRDSATNLNSAVPANGEPAWDTTNKRLRMGDGSTTGGILHSKAADVQNQTFQAAAAGGTADAITLTVSPVPAAYAAYQRFVFKASANNTGSATINVNSLGAKTLKKRTPAGLSDLAAGDIIQDGIYAVTYDGTYMQVEDVPVSAGGETFELISTATASTSAAIDIALPTGYSAFRLVGKAIRPATDNIGLWVRTSADGGSSFAAANSSYVWNCSYMDLNGAFNELQGTTAADQQKIALVAIGNSDDGVGNLSTETVSFVAEIFGANNANTRMGIQAYGSFGGTGSGEHLSFRTLANRRAASAINAIRILASSGNITSGDFYLYGMKDS